MTSRNLINRALEGDRVALARAISWVENEDPGADELLTVCFERSGRARRLGITGPPGAGKSTLATRMAKEYRSRGETVAIVAVDPTSPFSGGALLGDRVRMGELAGDQGVFIRSMATRGSMGGLAVHTEHVCDVLDAAGFGRILIETVGVGQSELEVAQTADSTAVVLVPESGDGIQAMKAGLMEIGDLFVVNKADREGAEREVMAVRTALGLGGSQRAWQPPVMLTIASQGTGVTELVQQFEAHLTFLEHQGSLEIRRRQRYERRIIDLLRERLWADFRLAVPDSAWTTLIDGYFADRLSPLQIAERLIGPDPRAVRRNGELSLIPPAGGRRGVKRPSPPRARKMRTPTHRIKASR